MRTILLLFLFLPFCSLGQVWDDFSDGNFTANPLWFGTDTCFTVNNNLQLQSSASAAGEAFLATAVERSRFGFGLPHDTLCVITSLRSVSLRVARSGATWQPSITLMGSQSSEWKFWLRENFSPSANNYAEVWLASDTPDPRQASHGYFLRFGAAGSNDAIELYRKDSEGNILICKGTEGAIASAFKVAVRVKRDETGHWLLQTDYANEGVYTTEAEGFDAYYPPDGYFAFFIKYTASNAKKFYLDDVYVGPEIVDLEPPELLELEVRDGRHLLLTFNEALDDSALEPQHYRLEPDTVRFEDNQAQVLLCFNEPFPANTNLTLQITGISDLAGNVMLDTAWDFSWYQASENDVVINEIMADPSPVVGLPEWEYVELFNSTNLTINLKDWTFQIGTTTKTFPAVQINPSDYLILCKEDAEQELQAYGKTCTFSSFAIANAGATLRLLDPDGALVSEVAFNDNWYHDADKKNGGWSLEQIDPYNPCAGAANWSASTDVSGGTPGRINSIDAPNATIPCVERVSMLGDNTVLVWFDQMMDAQTLADLSHYYVKELGAYPVEAIPNPVNPKSVSLLFAESFQEGEVYTLLLNGVESCSGHAILADTQVCFGIPNLVEAGDVLINEILFDPISPGVDYVELYNYSDKSFDLSELKLGVVKESFPNPADTVLKAITEESRLLPPHTFLLLSTDAYTVGQQYGCEVRNYVDMESFPTYSNSGGRAILMSRQGLVVDEMVFAEAMHDPFLKETKGVSLERVSWEVASMLTDNWHSAAAAVHYGTPGYENSMAVEPSSALPEGKIQIQPQTFSPDGDGRDDHCRIIFDLEETGNVVNVYVFSADGLLIRHLIKGELVGREGSFVWNGLDQKGIRAPLGLYIIVSEVYNSKGMVGQYKNVVAVSSR